MFKPQEITTLTSAKKCVCYIKLLNVSITEVGIAVRNSTCELGARSFSVNDAVYLIVTVPRLLQKQFF